MISLEARRIGPYASIKIKLDSIGKDYLYDADELGLLAKEFLDCYNEIVHMKELLDK